MPKYELKEGKGETKGVYSLGKKAKSEALKKKKENKKDHFYNHNGSKVYYPKDTKY